MSRTARFLKDGAFYYLQSQSARSQKIFRMAQDFEEYINLIKKYKSRFKINLYAYCLMPTSIHLIVYCGHARAIPLFMQGINQSYALFFNRKYNGLGKVWGQRYKSVLINGRDGLFEGIKLIEFVPVKEQRCASPGQYRWSSYADRVPGLRRIIDFLPSGNEDLSEVPERKYGLPEASERRLDVITL